MFWTDLCVASVAEPRSLIDLAPHIVTWNHGLLAKRSTASFWHARTPIFLLRERNARRWMVTPFSTPSRGRCRAFNRLESIYSGFAWFSSAASATSGGAKAMPLSSRQKHSFQWLTPPQSLGEKTVLRFWNTGDATEYSRIVGNGHSRRGRLVAHHERVRQWLPRGM